MSQNNQLSEILDHISDGFVALDKNWCYIYMNKKAGEIVNRDPDKMIGKNMWDEFPALKEDPLDLHDTYLKAMQEQKSFAIEMYYKPFEKWFETQIYPSSDGLTIYFKDITEKKKTEELITNIQQGNEVLINSTSDLLWSVSNNYTLIAANKAFINGLKENGGFLIKPGDNILSAEYFPEDFLQYWRSFYEKGLSGENVHTEAFTPTAGSTEMLWFELKIDPIKEGDQITSIACAMRNITERKKAEQALVESERFLQTLVSNLPGYYYRVKNNADYTPEFISEGVYSITGYKAKEYLIDRTISCGKEIIAEDQDWVWEKVQKAISQKKGYELSYRIKTKSGIEKWVWERGKAVWSPNGDMEALEGFVTEISTQKAIEKSLKESEEKYRTLVQQSADAIFLVDTEGNYLEANESASLITGYSIDELKKMNGRDLAAPADLKKNPLKTEEIKMGQKVFLERVIKRKDTTLLDVEITAKLMGNAKVIVSLRDVSERKKSSEALKKSLQRNAAFLNAIPDMIFVINREGVFTDFHNPSNQDALINPDQFLGKNINDILSPELVAETFKYIKLVIATGQAPIQYYQLEFPDGTRHFEARYAALNENEVLSIVRNITDRKKAEKELSESEYRLRTILETEPECVKILNLQSEVVDMNPAGLEMIGADDLAMIKGKPVLGIINEPYKAAFAGLTKKVFGGESGLLEFEITGLKGTIRWLETNAVPLKDVNGKIISLLAVTRDITERKITEEKIVKLNKELEQRVKDRTAELEATNAELVEINDLFVGREAWIIELKEELEKLKGQSEKTKSTQA